jgi:uncharacterized membrane protein YkvA (DUF1232 family)
MGALIEHGHKVLLFAASIDARALAGLEAEALCLTNWLVPPHEGAEHLASFLAALRVRKYSMLERWKHWAQLVKRDAHALYLAARDPRVPWVAKTLALAVAAYALSPIDLIPDFIPVFGYLDDLVIVPAGIALVIRLVPPDIMAEHRAIAVAAQDRPVSRKVAAIIVGLWVLSIGLTLWWAKRYI